MTGLAELLPCPQCGRSDLKIAPDGGVVNVTCGTCWAAGGYAKTADGAVAAWNRRASPSQRPAVDVVEALRALVEMRKGVVSDVYAAHQYRGNGASEWMREDDRDFRRELEKAFDDAAAALASLAPQVAPANPAQEKLGRFGHHPDPAIDFETEVHDLECEIYHHRVAFLNGTPPLPDLIARIERAMEFRVGGVETTVAAKQRLRELEKEAAALSPANPAQVTDAQIEHMVQQFLGWRLPETFGPDAGIRFERVANAGTPYEFRHEPVGTNLFDYTEAKAMVQHMLEGLPAAIGAGGQAGWYPPMTDDNLSPEERAKRDVAEVSAKHAPAIHKAITSALSQPHPADERVVEALRAAYEKVKLWPENRMPGVDITELGEGFMDLLALRNLIPDVLAALAAKDCR